MQKDTNSLKTQALTLSIPNSLPCLQDHRYLPIVQRRRLRPNKGKGLIPGARPPRRSGQSRVQNPGVLTRGSLPWCPTPPPEKKGFIEGPRSQLWSVWSCSDLSPARPDSCFNPTPALGFSPASPRHYPLPPKQPLGNPWRDQARAECQRSVRPWQDQELPSGST